MIAPTPSTKTIAALPNRITVLHAGPDPAWVGGMSTVIEVLVEERLGCDEAALLPTWQPHSFVGTLRLSAGAARRILTSPRDTAVHVHLSQRGSFAREGALMWLAHAAGHPTVATLHGATYDRFARSRPKLTQRVLGYADCVIALSPETGQAVKRLLPGTQVFEAPNPSASLPPKPIEETDKIVLFGGEIGLRKGVDLLVAAWPAVRSAHLDARCLIVGPRGDYEVPNVEGLEVLQPVSVSRMRTLIDGCRVVALPSRAEAMPMILTEAMGAGRPFVASRVGGIPELAVSDEQLISPGDVAGLAAALTTMLSHDVKAREIGDAGRALWSRTRSPEALEGLYREVYDAAGVASRKRSKWPVRSSATA